MTTIAPQGVSAVPVPGATPNVYHLLGEGIRITFDPEGAGPPTVDGQVKLVYQDIHHTLTFRAHEVTVDDVPSLGSLATVPLQSTPDVGSTTATVLHPKVVLGSAHSAPVHTLSITTMHSSTLAGLGHPQPDTYTVTRLRGSASVQKLSV
jgi:hypothetical protein